MPAARARATPSEMKAYNFPAGSMGPKVQAAVQFVERTGKRAAIGSLADIERIIAGSDLPDPVRQTSIAIFRRLAEADQGDDRESRNDNGDNAGRDREEETPEHFRQQLQTLGRRQLRGGDRPQAEVREEHATDPDDDASEMQQEQEGTHLCTRET